MAPNAPKSDSESGMGTQSAAGGCQDGLNTAFGAVLDPFGPIRGPKRGPEKGPKSAQEDSGRPYMTSWGAILVQRRMKVTILSLLGRHITRIEAFLKVKMSVFHSESHFL